MRKSPTCVSTICLTKINDYIFLKKKGPTVSLAKLASIVLSDYVTEYQWEKHCHLMSQSWTQKPFYTMPLLPKRHLAGETNDWYMLSKLEQHTTTARIKYTGPNVSQASSTAPHKRLTQLG